MSESATAAGKRIWAEVVARAEKDEAFRRALIKDPGAATWEAFGFRLPLNAAVEVSSDDGSIRLALPNGRLSSVDGKLTDEQLDQCVGGGLDTAWDDFFSFLGSSQSSQGGHISTAGVRG